MYRKFLGFVASLCLLLSVAGCVTWSSPMHIESNKDPDYKANIHRLAIVEELGTTPFKEDFNQSLMRMMFACGMQATLAAPPSARTSGNLSDLVVQKDADGNAFDATLIITLTSSEYMTHYGHPDKNPFRYHYAFTLRDSNGKKIWKSLMDIVNINDAPADKGQEFASGVVKQMIKDGLLTECSSNQQTTP